MTIKALKPIKTIFENRIKKSKNQILKKDEYVIKAKEIWELIDRDFGISTTIENVLKLKLDKFEQMLTNKFPELTSKEIEKIKESMGREFKFGQLYEINNNLIKENQILKEELNKMKDCLSENSESK